MKHLPLKLGIFVVLLFGIVTAACLLYTPLRVRYYTAKLKSDNPKERVAGVDGLLGMGKKGVETLAEVLGGGKEEAEFLSAHVENADKADGKYDCVLGYQQLSIALSPMHNAVEMRYKYALETLLLEWDKNDLAVFDNEYPVTMLQLAVSNGHYDIIELLITKGADVQACGSAASPLHLAVYENRKNIVLLLLSNGADLNAKNTYGMSPLLTAIEKGYKELATILIRRGTNVDAGNIDGRTPLHYTAWSNHKDIAVLLIEKGADINKQDNYGSTPLRMAAMRSCEEIVALLLGKGANLELKAKDMPGSTALDGAASLGNKDEAALLLESGAEVDTRTKDGWTPLIRAANYGHIAIVELLIKHGAKVNIEDNRGMTALDHAISSRNKVIDEGTNKVAIQYLSKIVPLLRAHGGMTGEEFRFRYYTSRLRSEKIEERQDAARNLLDMNEKEPVFEYYTERYKSDKFEERMKVVEELCAVDKDMMKEIFRNRAYSEQVRIPAGKLKLYKGSKVEIQSLWVDKYEVTNENYWVFCMCTGFQIIKSFTYDRAKKIQPFIIMGSFEKPTVETHDKPFTCVSLNEAEAYAYWFGMRLPTECEWEYAARADSKGKYCFGDNASLLDEYAWYKDNSGGKSHPVGRKKPNKWGLYDIHGNAAEIVNRPRKVFSGRRSYQSILFSKGGEFSTDWYMCQIHHATVSGELRFTGFRCVRDVEKGNK
ncbi:MAG: ankyrin repeat domain-containing protein [Planctomycetota bacterium]|jgi:ankyrin repeat protein